MTLEDIAPFVDKHHTAIATTYRRDGAAQMSILLAGIMSGKVVFVVRGDTAKLANLIRDPRSAVLFVNTNWSGYAAVDGAATLSTWDNTEAETQRILLRDAFKACGGSHSDWDEYDRAMRDERRAVVHVEPERIYGFHRPGS